MSLAEVPRPPVESPQTHEWSLSDGYRLRGRVWAAGGQAPRAALLYLHGIQSHGGWYEWSGALLAASGCAVAMPDRRGSGLNTSARGDAPSAQRLLDDLDEVAAWLRTGYPDVPLAVVGVSWGGKLAVAWALRRTELVSRLLLIAPGLAPRVHVSPLVQLRIGWSLLRGGQEPFPIPLSDAGLFTANPAGRRFIEQDPLKLTHATARFLYESSRLDRCLRRTPRGALTAQTTLLLAGADRIIHNARTEMRIRWLTNGRATVRTLPRAAHTLEFEPEVQPLAELLHEWAHGGPIAAGAAQAGQARE